MGLLALVLRTRRRRPVLVTIHAAALGIAMIAPQCLAASPGVEFPVGHAVAFAAHLTPYFSSRHHSLNC
jgi:hypothetical protein